MLEAFFFSAGFFGKDPKSCTQRKVLAKRALYRTEL